MSQKVECARFRDSLDDFVDGRIPIEDEERLRRHAQICAACAMQLRVKEHLAEPGRRDLERAVPDGVVESMWPSLESQISAGRRVPRRETGVRRWLIPALAAASLLFILGNGYLLMEVGRLREQSATLASEVQRQERRLAELRTRSLAAPRARTAALSGRTWQRVLAGREQMTVAELRDLLTAIPSSATLIGPDRAADLAGGFLVTPELAGGIPFRSVNIDDGIQAGELLGLLDSLEMGEGRSFPVARALEAYRLVPPRGSGGL